MPNPLGSDQAVRTIRADTNPDAPFSHTDQDSCSQPIHQIARSRTASILLQKTISFASNTRPIANVSAVAGRSAAIGHPRPNDPPKDPTQNVRHARPSTRRRPHQPKPIRTPIETTDRMHSLFTMTNNPPRDRQPFRRTTTAPPRDGFLQRGPTRTTDGGAWHSIDPRANPESSALQPTAEFPAPRRPDRRALTYWWSLTGSNRRPLLAKQALSQLSYGPVSPKTSRISRSRWHPDAKGVARPTGRRAPMAPPSRAARTAALNSPPETHFGSFAPLDNATEWWAWEDLNFRPHAYQARALTN